MVDIEYTVIDTNDDFVIKKKTNLNNKLFEYDMNKSNGYNDYVSAI